MRPRTVKNLRLALRWSQDDMADYLGVNRSSVSRYESDLEPGGPVTRLLKTLADDIAKGRRLPKVRREGRGRPLGSNRVRIAAE
jgi:transcriptional regulator with XRE-family HTH domain